MAPDLERSRLMQRRYRALRDAGVPPVEAGKACKGNGLFSAALSKAGGDPSLCPELSERSPRRPWSKKRARKGLSPRGGSSDTAGREAPRR